MGSVTSLESHDISQFRILTVRPVASIRTRSQPPCAADWRDGLGISNAVYSCGHGDSRTHHGRDVIAHRCRMEHDETID